MNRGYAFGFLIVLLVVILGMYVAYTGFQASREALRAQATVPVVSEGMSTRPPTRAPATATPTIEVLPTPMPGITVTLTALGPLNPPATEEPVGPAEPTTAAPEQPAAPAATDTPPPPTEAPPEPAATPVSSPAYQFRVAGPPGPDPGNPNCCYIVGTVRDAAGNGLEGVLVKRFNEWNPDVPPAMTKGGAEAGVYDMPIGPESTTWYVMLVDAAGNQISSQVQIQFNLETAGTYRIDWVRTY